MRSPFFVRQAPADSWSCKSASKLATVIEAKRNFGRATGRREGAWSFYREPIDRSWIEGTVEHDCMDAGGRVKQDVRVEGERA